MTTPTSVVFFDCDDCLYQNNWQTAGLLTARIDEFCVSQLNLPTGKAYDLYKKHGTCLKGLTEESLMENTEEAINRFLEYCHDVPLTDIVPDLELRAMILSVQRPRWVFTASVESHARRCLEALGISDCFLGIIDCKAVGLVTKHSKEAFEKAMEIAQVTDPSLCYFVDDNNKNIKTAKEMGWKTGCVGPERGSSGESLGEQKVQRVCEGADHVMESVLDMKNVWSELFVPSKEGAL
tara:strand:+ start:68 stop:778 length:711 start_codon:yes stop_codon:yes gene_type:complete